MPQAIERLLATPMISPRLPRIRPRDFSHFRPRDPPAGSQPAPYGIGCSGPSSKAAAHGPFGCEFNSFSGICLRRRVFQPAGGFGAESPTPGDRLQIPLHPSGSAHEEDLWPRFEQSVELTIPALRRYALGADAGRRYCRRSGAGHVGAGVTVGASVSGRRRP